MLYLYIHYKKSNGYVKYLRIIFLLAAYHLIFSLFYHSYILTHGGDSLGFWELSISNYRTAERWMDYFEYGNFFMQWLNYVPFKILGMSYFAGNLLYGFLGFLAFAELFRLGYHYWGLSKEWAWENSWVLLLFLPNLHFWTAGVGKETLLWLGLVLCLRWCSFPQKYWYLALFGIFLSFMVRPIHGALLVGVFAVWMVFGSGIASKKYKWVGLGVLLLGSVVSLKVLLRQTHLTELNFSSILAFFSSQQKFLEGFGADSYLEMAEMNFLERFWAVLFRPLPWEAVGFWQWAAALENSIFLVLVITALWFLLIKGKRPKLPAFLYAGLALTVMMMAIYAMTLNNFGIFMRMKSIFVVFFYFGAWKVIMDKSGKQNSSFSPKGIFVANL
ncbi:hypothetical protein [Pleomorphovibrio marinus]|uniref:hypothetical protein n=1 Tax=Pleomorphovibrio marinus TaxID=2164132 RepID=UPI0018E4E362|nr:hypothetical protein [Pleomorphovibrio marinus]